ncbi:glycosyl transferase family 90 [Roseimaritima sediminicola]|uniref:glycosyl transferase family 90 n=1 Tax=Roseimaritima sediminicola TaxID=2662066 RepID=UPI0012982BF8|nr:glycosyl transferase family 90 [Roseimaritima sediminicola]
MNDSTVSAGELPRTVALPPPTIFDCEFNAGYWKYVRGTLTALASRVRCQISDGLGKLGWSSFEIRVDGQPVAIDYSDYLLVDELSSAYAHWLRFHHTPAFVPFPNLGSFPPWSFWDWQQYERARQSLRYTAAGDAIIYRHSSLENRLPNVVERRRRALRLLQAACPERLQTGFVPQDQYFAECAASLAVVHIPGSHPHILDRSVQQMFALGVCVISPDLWSTCLEQRPQAGVHYVGILDDYSDLPEKVQWVADNRRQAAAIGQAAKAFFAEHCTPEAIWRYIHRRVHGRSHH